MTIHEAIFSTVRQPLLGVLYLLLTMQMALLFTAFRDGRSFRFRFACLLHLLLSFLFLFSSLILHMFLSFCSSLFCLNLLRR